MRKSPILFLTSLLILLAACKRTPLQTAIEAALVSAGDNRNQLEKVLAHYAEPADSLQLRAAQFLIANMPYHYGYYGKPINKYGVIFTLIDTLSYLKVDVTKEDKMHIGDSLLAIYGKPGQEGVNRIQDTRIVSAEFLITNIDFAYKAWKEAPWGSQVTFTDFCDFILPYRLRNEQVQYYRPSCYEQYGRMAAGYQYPDSLRFVFNAMNWDLVTEGTFTMYFNKYFPYPKSFDNARKGKIGGCETTTFFSGIAMQAAGLPVASDFIPNWGNNNAAHYMLHLAGQDRRSPVITNENRPVNTWSQVEWSSVYDEKRHRYTPNELPAGMYIQYIWTIPKIYRYTFSGDSTLIDMRRRCPMKEIAAEFRYDNFKDVTGDYLVCGNYTLQMPPSLRRFRAAYLSVFNISGWKPVAIAAVSDGRAQFKDIGKNVVYLPTVYDGESHLPAGDPFFIDSSNAMHMLKNIPGQRQDMHLLRKTALFPYTAAHSEVVKGGCFEGSNDSTFKRAELLDSIERYPFYMNEIRIKNPSYYRYLRYVSPNNNVPEANNIAEVQFYGEDGKQALRGAFIGSEGSAGHEIDKAFDNDMDSYYEDKNGKGGWIGIDLGPGRKDKVAMIRYCPRNDTNCILPGDSYELLYWDGGWVSLGIKKADAYALDYKAVPAGGLYWLRDLSGGQEERVFTYEKGMQIWW